VSFYSILVLVCVKWSVNYKSLILEIQTFYNILAISFPQCFQIIIRDVNIGFLGKPVIGFGKPVLNQLSVLLTFIKI